MALHQANCEICRRVDDCRAGRHPGLIAELDTGFAVLGDSQQFRGYALLLCKEPATELHELAPAVRQRYLEEMSQLAEAVGAVVKPHKLNYECLGNQVHHLHFHIFPRRLSDPQPAMPVWGQMFTAGSPDADRAKFDPAEDGVLLAAIRAALAEIRRRDGASGPQQSVDQPGSKSRKPLTI